MGDVGILAARARRRSRRGAARSHLFAARRCTVPPRMVMAMVCTVGFAMRLAIWLSMRSFANAVLWRQRLARQLFHQRDRLPDQLLDRGDCLGVVSTRHDGDRGAAAAGAAGAADPMHVVVGMRIEGHHRVVSSVKRLREASAIVAHHGTGDCRIVHDRWRSISRSWWEP